MNTITSEQLGVLGGPPARKRGGRPWRDATPKLRKKCITVLRDVAIGGLTLAAAAKKHKISLPTAKRYRDAALGYDDPWCEAIRRALCDG
jgi:hypothetical protein